MTSPLHQRSGPTTAWTTVNAAENIPGVMTPLGATFWLEVVELGMLSAFEALGVLRDDQVTTGTCPDDRFGAVFFGRFAGNVDRFRWALDLTPGASSVAFEEQVLGTFRERNQAERLPPWRYPVVAVKAPLSMAMLPRQIARQTGEVRSWWRGATGSGPAPVSATAQLRAAHARACGAIRMQMLATSVAQGLMDKLRDLSVGAGQPDAHLSLMTGYGDTEETEMISALHAIAHGTGSMDDFLARFGARCPGENELSARSWREDPGPVERLVAKYTASGRFDPGEQQHERARERELAEQRVLDGLGRGFRPPARLAFRMGRRYIPLREEGKAALAMTMDAARAAARRRGLELVADRTLHDRDDVFYLTLDEILGEPPRTARDLVAARKAERSGYELLELPQAWIGAPEAVPAAPARAQRVDRLVGVAAAAGVVQGRARVVDNPSGIDEVEEDEILVCRTTDPSWGAAFYLVSAAVIDIGGTASHGAIVAREMGMPCVINTREGTRVLRTGDLLRVDGTAGIVTVLEPAPAPDQPCP